MIGRIIENDNDPKDKTSNKMVQQREEMSKDEFQKKITETDSKENSNNLFISSNY